MSRQCPTCGGTRYVPDATVREIREQYATGARQKDLAAKYEVSQAFVSNVCTGYIRVEAGGPIAYERRYNRKAAEVAS
jgi:hypothetical protein